MVPNTDAFHGSIRVSLHQKTSIPHRHHFQSTMLPFRRVETHVPGYGSSRDPEVTASSGRHAASCRL